uniref:Uncharacterized protein n=1 Tax=Anguilla anguilla TaxID=7936 RepID=A0A0E9R7P8_ANGAN
MPHFWFASIQFYCAGVSQKPNISRA